MNYIDGAKIKFVFSGICDIIDINLQIDDETLGYPTLVKYVKNEKRVTT